MNYIRLQIHFIGLDELLHYGKNDPRPIVDAYFPTFTILRNSFEVPHFLLRHRENLTHFLLGIIPEEGILPTSHMDLQLVQAEGAHLFMQLLHDDIFSEFSVYRSL